MRLVIVEDDPLLLKNLTLLLSGEEGLIVAGSYATAEDALEGIVAAKPDMLLTDIGLPGKSGIELIAEVKALLPDLDVMVFTVYEDRDKVFAAIKAGATGYLLKGSSPREIIEGVQLLHQGGAPMSPKIARKIVSEFQAVDRNDASALSLREQEILKSIERGESYRQIGERHSISAHTVHTHIKNIYEKLQAADRNDALFKARKRGLL